MGRNMGRTFFVIAIFLCISSITLAQKAEAPPMEAINQFIEAQMRRQHIPGLSLAVVKDGDLLLTRGYGSPTWRTTSPPRRRRFTRFNRSPRCSWPAR